MKRASMYSKGHTGLCALQKTKRGKETVEERGGRQGGAKGEHVRYSGLSSILLHPESILTF